MTRHRRKFDGLVFVTVLLFVLGVNASASPQAAERRSLKWRTGKIVVSVSNSLLNQRLSSDDNVQQAIRDSLSAWEAAADLSLASRESNLQSISPKGAKGDGTSLLTIASTPENLKLFPNQANSPAATTRVFFNGRGEITEADIVLNPYVQFSTDGTVGTFDLRTVLTHEVGHLLGLEHSPVWGSRMFERTGKNIDQSSAARGSSLTLSDLAAVRSLYGARADEITCCGSVALTAVNGNSVSVKNGFAWLEEAATGRVVAAATARSGAEFKIGGVPEGKYRAFVQYELASGRTFSGSTEVTILLGDEPAVEIDSIAAANGTLISYIGLNAQLARMPLSLVPGQSQRIWAGGAGAVIAGFKPRFLSELVTASLDSLRSSEYGSNLKAISFDVRVAPEALSGEYSLAFDTEANGRFYMVGVLSVVQN